MTVYIDNPRIPYRRMLMSHMIADSTDELLIMATRIDLKHRWLQHPGRWDEHFDVSAGYRRRAIRAGAVEVTTRELVHMLRERRRG